MHSILLPEDTSTVSFMNTVGQYFAFLSFPSLIPHAQEFWRKVHSSFLFRSWNTVVWGDKGWPLRMNCSTNLAHISGTVQHWRQGKKQAEIILILFLLPSDSQRLLSGGSEDCHWCWLPPHWWCLCLLQRAWSGTSHPGEDCWREDQARRHILLWQGENLHSDYLH